VEKKEKEKEMVKEGFTRVVNEDAIDGDSVVGFGE
jgi:hypothetical protein